MTFASAYVVADSHMDMKFVNLRGGIVGVALAAADMETQVHYFVLLDDP